MAAQLDDGYTRIANEILEEISKTKLNGTQFRILMTVWRCTYGWNKKEHEISESYLSNATGIHKQQIKRELKAMFDIGILTEVQIPNFNTARVIAFNKRYLNSIEVSKKIPDSKLDTPTGSKLDTPTGSVLDTSPGSVLDTQKRKVLKTVKETNKEIGRMISEYTNNVLLVDALNEFVLMRTAIKDPLATERAMNGILKRLDEHGKTDNYKIKMLEISIINSWKSVFPLKKEDICESDIPNKPKEIDPWMMNFTPEDEDEPTDD